MTTPLPSAPNTNSPSTFSDDADRFLAALIIFQQELDAAGYSAGLSLVGSSTTSLTVGTGTKSLTATTGMTYIPGQGIFVASTASPSNRMAGIVTTYDDSTGALVFEALSSSGSGTLSLWSIGPRGADSILADDPTPTLSTDLNCAGFSILNSGFQQIADASLGTGTHTFDYSNGDMQQLTATGSITLAVSNFPSGKVCSMIIDAVNFGAHVITHPAAWLFASGLAPAYSVSGTDRLILLKDKDNAYTLHVADFNIKVV
jgi:hypothetical protein